MSAVRKMQESAVKAGEKARAVFNQPLSANPHDAAAHGSLAPYWAMGWKKADTAASRESKS